MSKEDVTNTDFFCEECPNSDQVMNGNSGLCLASHDVLVNGFCFHCVRKIGRAV